MNVNQKVVGIIEAFRQALGQLRSPASVHVFAGPTQCFGFRLHVPDATILFFTQLAEQQDKQVTWVEEARFRQAVDAFPLAWDQFSDVTVARGEFKTSLAEIIESEITAFFLKLGRLAAAERADFRDALISSNVAVLADLQSVEALDVEPVLARLQRDAKLAVAPQRLFRPPAREALFAKIVPDAIIDVRSNRSFRERLQAEWDDKFGWTLEKPCWSAICGGTEVSVFPSGLLVADTPYPHRALHAINSVLAALSYFGVACIPVAALEIGRLKITDSGEVLAMWGCGGRWRVSAAPQRTISAELLQQALQFAALACANEDVCTLLKLRHAGYVHFYSAEYIQAFVLWWTMLERLIRLAWEAHVSSIHVEQEKFERLATSQDLATDDFIEALTCAGKIPLDRYAVLQQLRKLADSVIVSGEAPTYEEALECAVTATSMLKDHVERLRSGGNNASLSRTGSNAH